MVMNGEMLSTARSFSAMETRMMRDAYVLASDAFRMTHCTSPDLETKLASIVLLIYTYRKAARPIRRVDVQELAEESLDTLVRFSNAEMRPLSSAEQRLG